VRDLSGVRRYRKFLLRYAPLLLSVVSLYLKIQMKLLFFTFGCQKLLLAKTFRRERGVKYKRAVFS
jgi:hypothetical protein